MNFTVAEALRLYPLSKGKVVAGKKGLLNEITSVSVLEIPYATKFLKKGEIEISAFYSVANSEVDQLKVIRMLYECGSSGLILSHVGMILKSVPSSMIDLCNELNFPLIIVPPSTAYIDIISPILDRLLKTQNNQLAYAMKIYDTMTNLILEEQDIESMLLTLQKLISRDVLLFNFNNELVGQSNPETSIKVIDYIKNNIQSNLRLLINERKDISIPSFENVDREILLKPIVSNLKYHGLLVVLDSKYVSELDKIAINQTKNSIGITIINKIHLKEFNSLIRHDYIRDLIQWNFFDDDTAIQRGRTLGYEIQNIKGTLILDIVGFKDLSIKYEEDHLQKIKSDFYEISRLELSLLSPDSILMNFSDKILILYVDPKNGNDFSSAASKMKRIGKHLIDINKSKLNLEISVGIGNCCSNISEIKNSYANALSCLKISNKLFADSRCVVYDDFKLFDYLRKNLEYSSLMNASEDLLSPIKKYDKEHGTNLYDTFEMLIENDLDTTKVSEVMFMHKNTILQRKKKIIELFGYDPFLKESRMKFEFLFFLKKLLFEFNN